MIITTVAILSTGHNSAVSHHFNARNGLYAVAHEESGQMLAGLLEARLPTCLIEPIYWVYPAGFCAVILIEGQGALFGVYKHDGGASLIAGVFEISRIIGAIGLGVADHPPQWAP